MNGVVETQDTPRRQISRRDVVVRLPIATISAAILAGCGSPLPIEPASVATDSVQNREIKGEVPGQYSEIVKHYDLVPRVFDETEDSITRVKNGIEYLRKFNNAVSNLSMEPLSTFHLNTSDNIPISIPQEYSLQSYIAQLLKEVDEGQLNILEDKNFNGFLGTYANFVYENGIWFRHSVISTGKGLISKAKYQESDSSFYSDPTDAEIAFTLIHEYAHSLQEQYALSTINNDQTVLQAIGNDQEKLKIELKKRHEEFNKIAQEGLIVRLPPDKSKYVDIIRTTTLSEAQATGTAYLFLWYLTKMNGTDHFPGTKRWDMSPIDIERSQQNYPDVHIQNFFDLFKNSFMKQGATDLEWIIEISGYKYE